MIQTAHSIIITISILILYSTSVKSQSFTNSTTANINSSAVTTRNIVVTGVPTTGMVLQQVNIDFGDNSGIYDGDMAKFNLSLVDPASNTVILLSPSVFTSTSSSSNKRFNIKLRDHPALMTPKAQATATSSTLSKGYPFNQGYYAPQESFSAFNTTTNVNGTWVFRMSGYSTSYGRTFNSVEIIFGPPLVVEDIRASNPNQSCATRKCVQTGSLIWADNRSYPTGQASAPPNSVGGCGWNGQKDNMAWFFFVASSATATISASGFSTVQESSVFKTTNCSSYTAVSGGCGPSDLFSGSVNGRTYFNGSYAGGYAWNQEYNLTGLTPGDEYLFVLDGQSATESDFYIEMLAGADAGCSFLPIELINASVQCNNDLVELSWQTVTEIDNDYFEIQKKSDNSEWEVITKINGTGNSKTIREYNYKEFNNTPITTYYRLKQVDFDGAFTYHLLGATNCNNKKEFNVFPNPSTSKFSFSIKTLSGNETMKITNLNGRVIYEKPLLRTFEEVNTIDWPKGMYFIQVNGQVQKLIIE